MTKTAATDGLPNDRPGTCDACGKAVPAGQGIEHYKEDEAEGVPGGLYCKQCQDIAGNGRSPQEQCYECGEVTYIGEDHACPGMQQNVDDTNKTRQEYGQPPISWSDIYRRSRKAAMTTPHKLNQDAFANTHLLNRLAKLVKKSALQWEDKGGGIEVAFSTVGKREVALRVDARGGEVRVDMNNGMGPWESIDYRERAGSVEEGKALAEKWLQAANEQGCFDPDQTKFGSKKRAQDQGFSLCTNDGRCDWMGPAGTPQCPECGSPTEEVQAGPPSPSDPQPPLDSNWDNDGEDFDVGFEPLDSPRKDEFPVEGQAQGGAGQSSVKRWMMQNGKQCVDPQTGECNATELAELAALEFGLSDQLGEETHWIWDVAAQVADKLGPINYGRMGQKQAQQEVIHRVVWFYHPGENKPVSEITAELAITPRKRAVGLSKHKDLHQAAGMLFVNPEGPKERSETFWMSTVPFPIDIVYLQANQKIGMIVHNAQPGSRENWTYPKTAAVVEVVGGYCKARGIKVGDLVRIGGQGKVAQQQSMEDQMEHARQLGLTMEQYFKKFPSPPDPQYEDWKKKHLKPFDQSEREYQEAKPLIDALQAKIDSGNFGPRGRKAQLGQTCSCGVPLGPEDNDANGQPILGPDGRQVCCDCAFLGEDGFEEEAQSSGLQALREIILQGVQMYDEYTQDLMDWDLANSGFSRLDSEPVVEQLIDEGLVESTMSVETQGPALRKPGGQDQEVDAAGPMSPVPSGKPVQTQPAGPKGPGTPPKAAQMQAPFPTCSQCGQDASEGYEMPGQGMLCPTCADDFVSSQGGMEAPEGMEQESQSDGDFFDKYDWPDATKWQGPRRPNPDEGVDLNKLLDEVRSDPGQEPRESADHGESQGGDLGGCPQCKSTTWDPELGMCFECHYDEEDGEKNAQGMGSSHDQLRSLTEASQVKGIIGPSE